MYSLPQPTDSALASYTAAVKTIKRQVNREPYLAAQSLVADLCVDFEDIARDRKFEEAIGGDFAVGSLGTDAMVDLYDKQFSQNKGTEEIRSRIKNSAVNSVCPYCGEGQALDLDHYLPKRRFAALTVHPSNLVPSCSDCNRAKRAYVPGPARPSVLHPYFDRGFAIPWLAATVTPDETLKPSVRFSVALDSDDSVLEARLVGHMEVFDLSDRFRVWAGQSLDDFSRLVASPIGEPMTLQTARLHLSRCALQQSGGYVNSWEAATFAAMGRSDWYLIDYLGLT